MRVKLGLSWHLVDSKRREAFKGGGNHQEGILTLN